MTLKSDNRMLSAREVALAILKPSQKDLEHGLELHRESLVIESYGLGLHAPVDADALNALNETAGSVMEYQDAYEGQIMLGWARSAELREEYKNAWEASGVNCIFLNAGQECNDPMRLIKRFARYVNLTDLMSDVVRRVTSAEQIVEAHKDGKRALCLTLNGVPLTGEQFCTSDELRYLRVFAQLGVKMMHLTYNRRNAIGDGCGEATDAGLSDFGREVVREMNRLGIIIDVAHSGLKTSLDAALASEQPIVASHSGAWELSPHIRCKTDEVIRAIVERGGTMGITNVPRFLGGTGDITAFLNHIDYVAKKFGVDAVTIGTDQSYRSEYTHAQLTRLKPARSKPPMWENLWPEGSRVSGAEWSKPEQTWSMVWTNWPLFTVGLVQRGYSDDDIRKIIGGNILRVARQVWKNTPAL